MQQARSRPSPPSRADGCTHPSPRNGGRPGSRTRVRRRPSRGLVAPSVRRKVRDGIGVDLVRVRREVLLIRDAGKVGSVGGFIPKPRVGRDTHDSLQADCGVAADRRAPVYDLVDLFAAASHEVGDPLLGQALLLDPFLQVLARVTPASHTRMTTFPRPTSNSPRAISVESMKPWLPSTSSAHRCRPASTPRSTATSKPACPRTTVQRQGGAPHGAFPLGVEPLTARPAQEGVITCPPTSRRI
jgi:hypothetical protein